MHTGIYQRGIAQKISHRKQRKTVVVVVSYCCLLGKRRISMPVSGSIALRDLLTGQPVAQQILTQLAAKFLL
jgi:hypothetical protein